MRRTLTLIATLGSLVALGSLNTAFAAPGPKAVTGSATAVTQSGAKLNGTVDPNGTATSYHFSYGPTANYGSQTPNSTTGTGTQPVNVTRTLTGLASGTTYHYRLVASNSHGTSTGLDRTFTTNGQPPAPSRLALFGQTAFVSPTHVFGVFVGCIGSLQCTGSMKVVHNGKVIGQRSTFFVAGNDGGIVHLTLNSTGRSFLAHAPGHHLSATVTVTGLNGTTGNSSKTVTIVPFS
jgi:hypothetical protein